MRQNYSDSTAVLTSQNHPIWAQGFLLRKLPGKDALLPVQVWFDPSTGQICKDTIPPEFRDELETFSFNPLTDYTNNSDNSFDEISWGDENNNSTSDETSWGTNNIPENNINDTSKNSEETNQIQWGN